MRLLRFRMETRRRSIAQSSNRPYLRFPTPNSSGSSDGGLGRKSACVCRDSLSRTCPITGDRERNIDSQTMPRRFENCEAQTAPLCVTQKTRIERMIGKFKDLKSENVALKSENVVLKSENVVL